MDGDDGHEFGQAPPPLAVYIKKILDRYPDGQIMKELLQNAEDAGATELRLTLDLRLFGCDSLHDPKLNVCQGPSLLAYNDANFTQSDWKNIQQTERSYKDHDPTKIGRFGIGFNAIYHLTDFPWIVSGTRVGVFDPRETGIFTNKNGRASAGYSWNLDNDEHRARIQTLSDQFEPLGLDLTKRNFHGTLFRFPLRQSVIHSEPVLSNALYDADRTLELFRAFTHDADRLLLFLNSVNTVSIEIIGKDSTDPVRLYLMEKECIYPSAFPRPLDNNATYHETEVTVQWFDFDHDYKFNNRTTRWAIEHHIPKEVSAPVSKMAKEKNLLPWVGVACQLDLSSMSNDGRISCFLPLPPTNQSRTELPLEIHGYFCLTDSRQGVLWSSVEHENDPRTDWNSRLVNEILPSAYLFLLENIVNRQIAQGNCNLLVAHLFPDLSHIYLQNPFRKMADSIYAKATDLNLFWSPITKSFVSSKSGVFSTDPLPQCVMKACLVANVPLVDAQSTKGIPDYFLQVANLQVRRMSAKFIADLLRKQSGILIRFSPQEKRELLSYLLTDGDCSLDGIPLLMLANRSFVAFKTHNRPHVFLAITSNVYVVSDQEHQLLPGLDHLFLHESYIDLLASVRRSGKTQLRVFMPRDMPILLKLSLESGYWKPEEQLQQIWNYIHNYSSTVGYGSYEKLPLLPVMPSRNSPGTVAVARLDKSNKLLTSTGLDASIVSWLQNDLEMVLVEDQPYLKGRRLLADYIFDSSSPDQCIEAIWNVWRRKASQVIGSIERNIHREKICIWLRKQIQSCTMKNEHLTFLIELPILTPFQGKPAARISAKDAGMRYFESRWFHTITFGLFANVQNLLHEIGFPHPVISSEDAYFAILLKLLPMSVAEITKIIIHSIHNGFYEDKPRKKALDWIFSNYQALQRAKAPLHLVGENQVLRHLTSTAEECPIDENVFKNCCVLLKQLTKDRFEHLIASRAIFPCRNGTLHEPHTLFINCSLTGACPYICEPVSWLKRSSLLDFKIDIDMNDLINAVNKIQTKLTLLNDRQLKAHIEILSKLRDLMVENEIDSLKNFKLPDINGKLCFATELSTRKVAFSEDQVVVHRDIPLELALFFGAKSVDVLQLEQFEFVGEGDEFGQEVDLVQRIESLLEQYHSEHDIFQEFVQNADDAGATEISFFIDERQHRFSDIFKALEGPALLIYNNSTFSDEDIIGIQKLGVGSKTEDREKIGRYGAGFNCAYKYTDCPSFISDDKDLCIFDPLRAFSKNDKKCGRRFTVSESFCNEYPEFYDCYNVPDFSLNGGTMFRLPVSLQNICPPEYPHQSPITVHKQIFQSVSEHISQMLIFLKNVSEISGHCIDQNGKCTTLWKFQSTSETVSHDSKDQFNAKIHQFAKHPSTQIPLVKTSYQLTIENLLKANDPPEKWLVVQQLGFSEVVDTDFHKIKLLPVAGVATQLPVLKNAAYQLFCSLPLPQMTDLPVSINGHFALDSEGRKNLFTPISGSTDLRQKWNDFILNDIVVSSYCELLNVVKFWAKQLINDSENEPIDYLNAYWNLFPTFSKVTANNMHDFVVMSCKDGFVCNFYKYLYNSASELIPCFASQGGVEWLSFTDEGREPIFPYNGVHSTFLFLRELGMKITPAPEYIQECFTESGVTVTTASPSVVATFLRGPHTTLPPLPHPVKNTVFKTENRVCSLLNHVTQQSDQRFSLHGSPLLITADHQLRKFDQNNPAKLEEKEVAHLFLGHQNLFVSPLEKVSLEMYQNAMNLLDKHDPCFNTLTLHDLITLLPGELQKVGITEIRVAGESYVQMPIWLSPISAKQSWLNTLWILISRLTPNAETFSQFLQSFENWPLIPAQLTIDGPIVLFKTNLAANLFLPNVWQHIKTRFPLVGLPVFAQTDCLALSTSYILNLFNDASVIAHMPHIAQALHFWHNKNLIKWPLMDYDRHKVIAVGILKYFTNCPDKNIRHLRYLPLFEHFDGSVAAVGDQRAFTFKGEDLPMCGKAFWMTKAAFLKSHDVFCDLYSSIGIDVIDEPQLYSDYILPTLPMMLVADQVLHLSYICYKYRWYPSKFEVVMSTLKDISFIAVNGMKKRVSEFVHHHPLFDEMWLPDAFLPKEFSNLVTTSGIGSILDFFVRLGLQTEPTQMDCTTIAKKLTLLAGDRGNFTKIEKVAKMLWDYLYTWSREASWKPCFQEISLIPFIPSVSIDLRLLTLCEAAGEITNQRLMRTKGLSNADYTHLLWTVEPILPNWANGSSQFLSLMGILDPPPEEKVMRHFKNLFNCLYLKKIKSQADTGVNSPLSRSTLETVLKSFYEYLQMGLKNNSLTDDAISKAAAMPLVLVENGRRLAYPFLVVDRFPDIVDEAQGLPPFLFKLPNELNTCSSLFQKLGAKNAPSVFHYAKFLEMVHYYYLTDEGHLQDPNLSEKVQLAQTAMIQLFNVTSVVSWEHVKCLYLPNPKEILLESTKMVYASSADSRWCDKLQSVLWPIPDGLHTEAARFIDSLPAHLKLKILKTSDNVNHDSSRLCQGPSCFNGQRINELLLLPDFLDALKRLNFAKTRKFPLPQGLCWDDIMERLQSLDLKCYESLVIDTRDVETREILHEKKAMCFLEERTISVTHSDVTSTFSHYFHSKFSLLLQEYLEGVSFDGIVFDGVIRQLLKDPSGLESFLNEFDIPTLPTDSNKRPKLGTPVSNDLVDFLEMHPLNYYRPGEYVAYLENIDDPEIDFLWARIIRCTTDTESLLTRHYHIELDNKELYLVSAQDLYKFVVVIKNLHPGELVPTDAQSEAEEINRKDVDLNAACEEVRRILAMAWTLDGNERKKILHRLYLAWHPDKNEECNKILAMEVFKFLQNEIKQLEKGMPAEQTFSSAQAENRWRSYRSGGSSNSHEWQRYSTRDRSTGDAYSFRTASGFSATTQNIPDKRMAHEYWTQAEHDRDAACDANKAAISGENIGSEHVIFFAQQAVEKALKAVLFRKIGCADRTHDLLSLVHLVSQRFGCLRDVVLLVESFVSECHPDCSWLRYPRNGVIPHNTYKREQANKAARFAIVIMNGLKSAAI